MKTFRILAAATLLLAASTSAEARPWRHVCRHCHRPAPLTTVVIKGTAPGTVNRIDRGERLDMAVAYIREHGSINARKYGKITGMPKSVAEAELDAFAADERTPIVVSRKNSKTYILA